MVLRQRPAAGSLSMSRKSTVSTPRRKTGNIIFRLLGPGLVTGAADDDPSGIATYSQAGAQFGYGLLWTVFLTTPFMIAIQLVSAHIGRVTGKGIAANAKQFYPLPLVLIPVGLLVVANTINIAADLAAMGEALYLDYRRPQARARTDLCRVIGVAAGVRAIPPLCPRFEVSYARAVFLCGCRLHNRDSMARRCSPEQFCQLSR